MREETKAQSDARPALRLPCTTKINGRSIEARCVFADDIAVGTQGVLVAPIDAIRHIAANKSPSYFDVAGAGIIALEITGGVGYGPTASFVVHELSFEKKRRGTPDTGAPPSHPSKMNGPAAEEKPMPGDRHPQQKRP